MITSESNIGFSDNSGNDFAHEEPHRSIVRPYLFVDPGRRPEISEVPVDVRMSWFAESQDAVYQASLEAYENRRDVEEPRVNVVDIFFRAARRMRETDEFQARARSEANKAYYYVTHPHTTAPSPRDRLVQTTEERVPQSVQEDARNNLPVESIKPRRSLLRTGVKKLAAMVMQFSRPRM